MNVSAGLETIYIKFALWTSQEFGDLPPASINEMHVIFQSDLCVFLCGISGEAKESTHIKTSKPLWRDMEDCITLKKI